MAVKIIFLVIFFAVMIGVGLYSRKHATNVNDFVLGGRSVGPWLTAFAYGTSYFSAVVFVGYAGQFGYKYGLAATWIGIGNAERPGTYRHQCFSQDAFGMQVIILILFHFHDWSPS